MRSIIAAARNFYGKLFPRPVIDLPEMPEDDDADLGVDTSGLHNGTGTIMWSLGEAICIWLSQPGIVNGRWTCAEIAQGLNDAPWYRSTSWVTIPPTSVNAAISGISIRARRKLVTDIAPEDSLHVSANAGLSTPWQYRRWQLTPMGLARAINIARSGERKLAHFAENYA